MSRPIRITLDVIVPGMVYSIVIMNILLGFHYHPYPVDIKGLVDARLKRISDATGHALSSFCLTLNPPGPPLTWPQLDARWKRGDLQLMKMYEAFAVASEKYDAVMNWNGINLHPEFVRQLPVFKVFCCFDDPESSHNFSRPAAASYDLSLVGNIAEVETYRTWGVQHAEFWPMGFLDGDFDRQLTKEKILNGDRRVSVTLLCERESRWRAERLDQYTAAFPDGMYYGAGWPRGFLPEDAKTKLYQQTKIGPNFHNSTGPINFRTYILPANGVMQICDNKSFLGKIFELDREVVGFDTVDEAIELTRYYCAHDDERRRIAAAGWERATREYNEVAVFEKAVAAINRVKDMQRTTDRAGIVEISSSLRAHRLKTLPRSIMHHLKSVARRVKDLLGRVFRRNLV